MRRIVWAGIWILALVALARFCHHATHGFSLAKIRSNLPLEGGYSTESVEDPLLQTILQGKFHYLSRGLQSFVFVSEDGQYVLKLFNNRYQRKIALFSLVSHLPWAAKWTRKRIDYFRYKQDLALQSYQLAFEAMRDKTGLCAIHLRTTSHLPGTLTLVDPLQISHTINPNEVGFLIQKKATPVYPTLQDYVTRQDMEGAKQALSSLIELFFWKWGHGIADNDPLIRTNYGFIEGRAIQIDVGPLSRAEKPLSLSEKREQIGRITTSLKYWLSEKAPQLTTFLDEELESRLSSRE